MIAVASVASGVPQTPTTGRTIGIQVGAVSFVDEGVESVLDRFQRDANINALFIATFSYGRGIAGRQVPGQPLPDHGKQEYDAAFHGGNFASTHGNYYQHTSLKKIAAPDTDKWNKQMYRIRVFDELVYDTDANLTNVLIGEDWKVWRVDFSRAFRTSKDLHEPKNLVKCDRQLFEKLKTLTADELAEKTKHYLNKSEVNSVLARRDKIVATFQTLIAEKGEQEILY